MTQGNSIIKPSDDALFVSLLSIAVVATVAIVGIVAADFIAQVVLPSFVEFIEWTIESVVNALVSHP